MVGLILMAQTARGEWRPVSRENQTFKAIDGLLDAAFYVCIIAAGVFLGQLAWGVCRGILVAVAGM